MQPRGSRDDNGESTLSGAELAGARFTRADLDGTILSGARDAVAATGLDHARHADTIIGLAKR